MEELTAEDFGQRIFNLNLLDSRQLEAVWSELGTRDVAASDFLNLLVRRGLLTNYQVERLKRGERSGFFYGDYKVLYLVGTGSFARVYRAVQKDTGKVVAVKVLRKRFSDEPKEKDQFLREGKMGTTLRHPNIVPIYEVHSKGRSHFLVMNFIEGQNLRDFVKMRRKLDPLEATKITADVAAGLAYAFEKGITHRDLKLSNALISSTGRAQLVDFGLAAMDDNISEDSVADHPNPRTIDYAALERSTGVRKGDPRSDIYFTGCMYYHMLAGQPPLLETTDRLQRLSKSRFEKIVPIGQLVPDLPSYVSIVLNKAMDFNPDRRYQTPAELLFDLKRITKRLEAAKSSPRVSSAVHDEIDDFEAEIAEGASKAVMIVESNKTMQDLFRERLKKHGYRVLVISDPARALDRLDTNPCPADCVVFSARELGQQSLEAFNRMARMEFTKSLPAILLLEQAQTDWKEQASLSDNRVVVMLPIKFRHFRLTLKRLVSRTGSLADHS